MSTGPAEAVKKWCGKNRRNSLKPHSRRVFIISKNLILTGKKSTAAKAGVAAMLPPVLEYNIDNVEFDDLTKYSTYFIEKKIYLQR